jgi:hypothetical protein
MGMILRISVRSGLLNVTATGEFSLEEAERTFLEILDAVAQHKTEKILFDGRKLTGEPEYIERFFYGKFVADMVARFRRRGVVRAPQFAYVLQEPVLDPRRFGETVAVNRGMWVKAFDNLDGALGWLRLAPTSKADAGDV